MEWNGMGVPIAITSPGALDLDLPIWTACNEKILFMPFFSQLNNLAVPVGLLCQGGGEGDLDRDMPLAPFFQNRNVSYNFTNPILI